MLSLQRNKLSAWFNLLLLVGLAAPSLHALAHFGDATPETGEMHDAAHIALTCKLCDIAGTLAATEPKGIPLHVEAPTSVVVEAAPAWVYVAALVSASPRAPPVLAG